MVDVIEVWLLVQSPLPADNFSKFTRKGEQAFYRDNNLDYSPTLFCRRTPAGKTCLSVQGSLPKLLYGHNVKMLSKSELGKALKILQKFAATHFGIPFDIYKANVRRIEYCYNFSVGEDLIYSYLYAAAEADPPHLKRRLFGKIETVEFANDSRKIYCYDKGREVENEEINDEIVEAARGVLRLEVRYNSTEAVKLLKKQLNLPDIQVRTLLKFSLAKSILKSGVKTLGLHKTVIPFDQRLFKLKNKYGYGSKFHRLAGFLYLCGIFGYDKLIDIGIMKRSAYYKHSKELADADALVFSNYYTKLKKLYVR